MLSDLAASLCWYARANCFNLQMDIKTQQTASCGLNQLHTLRALRACFELSPQTGDVNVEEHTGRSTEDSESQTSSGRSQDRVGFNQFYLHSTQDSHNHNASQRPEGYTQHTTAKMWIQDWPCRKDESGERKKLQVESRIDAAELANGNRREEVLLSEAAGRGTKTMVITGSQCNKLPPCYR